MAHKLTLGALLAVLLTWSLMLPAWAHAPCDHRTHRDWSWRHLRYETIEYQRSVSVDLHHYRDVYRNTATGETLTSGLCP